VKRDLIVEEKKKKKRGCPSWSKELGSGAKKKKEIKVEKPSGVDM